jgi:hypothetical protein
VYFKMIASSIEKTKMTIFTWLVLNRESFLVGSKFKGQLLIKNSMGKIESFWFESLFHWTIRFWLSSNLTFSIVKSSGIESLSIITWPLLACLLFGEWQLNISQWGSNLEYILNKICVLIWWISWILVKLL